MLPRKRILLVHPSLEMKRFLEDILRESFKEQFRVSVQWVEDVKVAKSEIESETYDLVIARSDAPLDRKQTSGIGDQRSGLELLRWLREQDNRVPCVLISLDPGKEVYEAQRFDPVRFVIEGEQLEEGIILTSKDFLTSRGADESVKRVDIEITLNQDRTKCGWEMKGVGFPLFAKGGLSIEERDLKDLVEDSEEFQREGIYSNWKKRLHRIGRNLTLKIIEGNPKFAYELGQAIGVVNRRVENTRIRFVVEENVYPILLEAILEYTPGIDNTREEDYWMLKAPVYRWLPDLKGLQYPLFQGPGEERLRINCLIVMANISGPVKLPESNGKELLPLNNAPLEATELGGYLEANRDRFSVGFVKIIDKGTEGRTFREEVEYVITEWKDERGKKPEWHIVHFAGHTYYVDEKKEGYFVLPGDPIEKVEAGVVASWLAESGTRFVYLSSCRSSKERFVVQLTKKLVPAVIGFRWDIADDKAAEYTKIFYEYLFEKRSLEAAFLAARKRMKENAGDDPIWASPVLVIQGKA